MLQKVNVRLCMSVGQEKRAREVSFHYLLFAEGARHCASCRGLRKKGHFYPVFSDPTAQGLKPYGEINAYRQGLNY